MARKLLRRLIPSAATIKNTPALHFLGDMLHDPNLFHLNRHSVSVAFFVGIFVAFIPLPGQMPIAALMALLLRCNLPISVVLVWISNPVTMPAMFFATYQLGRWLLGTPPVSVSLELSLHWLVHEFSLIWKPLLAGSLISGLIFGSLGYITMRIFWRWTVVKNWQRRNRWRRERRASEDGPNEKKGPSEEKPGKK
ncbi:DUF2062 domain-containing protein [Marinimicrobium sp. C2-29]|uniref:DUF2062 domain-containing protein n=1 Tax=Marinimicrobium sp. C2-29 TaxID=3139825 RepID=UPI003138B2BA